MRIFIAPFKTNSPTIIDSDGILPVAIAAQFFQAVAGRGWSRSLHGIEDLPEHLRNAALPACDRPYFAYLSAACLTTDG
jgi:hypothetical protein